MPGKYLFLILKKIQFIQKQIEPCTNTVFDKYTFDKPCVYPFFAKIILQDNTDLNSTKVVPARC